MTWVAVSKERIVNNMMLVCFFLLPLVQLSHQDDGTDPTTVILTVIIASVAVLLFLICMVGLFCYWYRGRIWPLRAEKCNFDSGPVTRRTHRHHHRSNCVHPRENNLAENPHDIALPIADIANINVLPPAYEQCELPPPAYDSIFNQTAPGQ